MEKRDMERRMKEGGEGEWRQRGVGMERKRRKGYPHVLSKSLSRSDG